MYTVRTVKMNRQRGGITTAYLVSRDGVLVKAFHTKVACERFMKTVNG